MSLPPALLKRLAKRGLVDKGPIAAPPPRAQAPAEEIIAEDYDDVEAEPYDEYKYDYQPKVRKGKENFWSERLKRRITDSSSVNGYDGCPNKINIYHRCTLYCRETYGDGIKEPTSGYLIRKARLLKRHPLPKDWTEVYDRGTGVHYYLNSVDNTVSWLPPSHPKAVVGKSAAQLRKEMEESQPNDADGDDNDEPNADKTDLEMPGSLQASERDVPVSKPMKKPRARDLEKVLRAKSERRHKKESNEGHLDPMDPAAYSDIPRGKWSAGLENENRKTGVDSSVSGTLFQMRPYPSPGAVLQSNAAAAGKKKDSDLPNDDGDHEQNSDDDED